MISGAIYEWLLVVMFGTCLGVYTYFSDNYFLEVPAIFTEEAVEKVKELYNLVGLIVHSVTYAGTSLAVLFSFVIWYFHKGRRLEVCQNPTKFLAILTLPVATILIFCLIWSPIPFAYEISLQAKDHGLGRSGLVVAPLMIGIANYFLHRLFFCRARKF